MKHQKIGPRRSAAAVSGALELIDAQAVLGINTVKASRFATTREEQARWLHELHAAMAAVPEALRPPARRVDPRRFSGPFVSRDFDGLVISFDGVAKFDWGPLLERVNADPYQRYFLAPQVNQPTAGGDIERAPWGSGKWGFVRLAIQSMEFSDRFGGSVHFRILPIEPFGIELGDSAKNLYLELRRWILHLYFQPRKAHFNNPSAAKFNLARNLFAELEIKESETCQRDATSPQSGPVWIPLATASETEVNALIGSAAAQAAALLQPLGLFALGFLHEKLLPRFDARSQKVVRVCIGGNSCVCHVDAVDKAPYVEVLTEVRYLGTDRMEGPFDDDPEVTAEPTVAVLSADTCLLSNQCSKYIGSGESTGWLSVGYMSLEETSRAVMLRVIPFLTESDPILDDLNMPPFFEWNLGFSLPTLQALAAANTLGQIGPMYQDVKEDMFVAGLTIEVSVIFRLVKF